MTAEQKGLLVGAAILAAIVAGMLWLHANYRCVRQHEEWRTDCSSTGTTQTCRTYLVQVCDQYERR